MILDDFQLQKLGKVPEVSVKIYFFEIFLTKSQGKIPEIFGL